MKNLKSTSRNGRSNFIEFTPCCALVLMKPNTDISTSSRKKMKTTDKIIIIAILVTFSLLGYFGKNRGKQIAIERTEINPMIKYEVKLDRLNRKFSSVYLWCMNH